MVNLIKVGSISTGLRHVATILNAINYNVQPVNLVISTALVEREQLHQSFRSDSTSNEMTLIIWLDEINTSH